MAVKALLGLISIQKANVTTRNKKEVVRIRKSNLELTLSLAARAGKKLPLHKESLQSGS
jgi:DNA-binding IclR family transcriptional regulator